MRSVTVELCGERLELPVTFAAGEALAKAGFDPLEVAALTNDGQPAIRTSAAVITILHTGAASAKSKLTRAQVGEAVIHGGLIRYLTVATDYLAAFLSASPEHPVPQGNESA